MKHCDICQKDYDQDYEVEHEEMCAEDTKHHKKMKTHMSTSIPGLFVIERPVYVDDRGFFHEIYRQSELEKAGVTFDPVQQNHARSNPGVIRGLHTEGWQKLVYPVNGKIFVAIADVRPDSPAFGCVETFTLDSEDLDSKHIALFLPPRVGNSVCVIGDKQVDYIYLVDEYWAADKVSGIAWDDPDLNIPWPVNDPIVSERDRKNPTLRELYPEKFDDK